MKTITDEEAGAVKWLIHWTYEEVEQIRLHAKEMSRSGETESTYGDTIQKIIDTLNKLEEKL